MLDTIMAELRAVGHPLASRIVEFPCFGPSPKAIVMDVEVLTGRYIGQVLQVGISFQENSYPEYPPHFIHFKATVKTTIVTPHSEHLFEDEVWYAYSLPPSDFWDRLEQSQKNMSTYFYGHLMRIFHKL